MRSRFPVFLASFFVLSACAESRYAEDPLYDVGYGDGCAAAQSTGVGGRPAPRSTEDAYRAGWSAGYGSCGGNSSAGRSDDDPLGDRR